MKTSLSVIILTFNEELNIEQCLKSVADWADEILVVDSYSTDKTLEIAKKYGARVAQREFKNQAEQFNWALDNLEIKNEWILRLDADEEILPELKEEIEKKLSELPPGVNGVALRRRTYFMGKWMKYGGVYPTIILRMFRKGLGVSENREMDEHIILKSGKEVVFENDFIDNNKKGLSFWISKHRDYARREAASHIQETLTNAKLKNSFYYSLPSFFRAFFYFFYRYFLKLGFLDGIIGFQYHFLHAFWYRFLVDVEICKLNKKI